MDLGRAVWIVLVAGYLERVDPILVYRLFIFILFSSHFFHRGLWGFWELANACVCVCVHGCVGACAYVRMSVRVGRVRAWMRICVG